MCIAALFTFSFSLFTFTACEKDIAGSEPERPAGNGGHMVFSIGIAQGGEQTPQTRTATDALFATAWTPGDEIGLFACTTGGTLASSGNYIQNVKLTYDGTTWTPSEQLLWPGGGGKLDFYAYYPYDVVATDPSNIAFNVLNDQSTAGNYSLSDLLTAKADNGGAGYGKGQTIPLTFCHALSLVQVSIPKEGAGYGPSTGLTVRLWSVKAGGQLNLNNISTTAGSEISLAASGNNAVNITMWRVEQAGDANYTTSYTYRALVPAQTVVQGASLFFFEHEQRQMLADGALSANLAMTAGQAEKFERTLPATLIETVPIPSAGVTFMMGSPATEPNHQNDEIQHSVTLTQDFYMSRYAVTNAQYAAFLNAAGISSSGYGSVDGIMQPLVYSASWGVTWNVVNSQWLPTPGYNNHPVIWVTWYGAKAFADYYGFRLPTEAQWEYAARGSYANKATETATKPFGIGDGTKLVLGMANYPIQYSYDLYGSPPGEYNVGNNTGYLNTTSAVGGYLPNNYGLYDMHGNVWEWCSDWYGDYSSSAVTDPTGPATGSFRVLRGGSWNYGGAKDCRSANRYYSVPGNAIDSYGFRVVIVP
jgi:formylglycine-generating enzyme required for sulfatase activity